MRPLTEEETQVLFRKLANYTGTSLKNLIAPLDNSPDSDRYVFRLHQSRCYYVRLSLANLATSISRHQLLSLGTCLGMHLPRLHRLRSIANPSQEDSPKPSNSACTLLLSPSSHSMRGTKYGSSLMARCPSCTAATSSKRAWGGGQKTVLSIRELWFTI